MKAVILAGGLGTRLAEETHLKPKPMVEIGGRPILWHIMKLYSAHGVNEFVICCGYRGYVIKEYFANYFLHMSDVTFDMATNSMTVHERKAEPWKVTLVDTGDATLTAGRLKRVAEHVRHDDCFCFTYGDGGRINGGFLVLSPAVLDTIAGDHSSFESETLPALAARAQLEAFDHHGFWLAMDTVRDRTMLEELWQAGRAPWKAWA